MTCRHPCVMIPRGRGVLAQVAWHGPVVLGNARPQWGGGAMDLEKRCLRRGSRMTATKRAEQEPFDNRPTA
jgi:hypothetical protein